MNTSEWLTICKTIEARWGNTGKWVGAPDMWSDEKVISLEAVHARKAMDRLDFDLPGASAPSPVEVVRLGHELQAAYRRLERGMGECPHENWAFNDLIDPPKNGRRLGQCVNCGVEKWLPLETASEAGLSQWPDLERPE